MATIKDTENSIIQSFGSCYKQLIASDVLKALVTAFFTAFFATLLMEVTPLFNGSELPAWTEVKAVLIASVGAGLGAITRKYFTNSTGQLFKKDAPNVDNSAAVKE